MKQEPTGAARSAAGGIPAIHGREDVNRRCAIAGSGWTPPSHPRAGVPPGDRPASAALTVLVAAAVVALRRPPKRTRFPYGIPRQEIR